MVQFEVAQSWVASPLLQETDLAVARRCRRRPRRTAGCRARKRTNNAAFWKKYEACIADQGAGWC
jgi:hypothetical protein